MTELILEGYTERVVTSQDFKALVDHCNMLKADGFTLVSTDNKIKWPFIWRVEYTAIMRKHFIARTAPENFSYIEDVKG